MLAQPAASRAQERTAIQDFNSQLAQALATFKSAHSGAMSWTWDADASFNKILDKPKDYGFRDATSYGNGTQYFWGLVSNFEFLMEG
jgi:phospholipase/lecithinase/hemolysin